MNMKITFLILPGKCPCRGAIADGTVAAFASRLSNCDSAMLPKDNPDCSRNWRRASGDADE